MAKVYLSSTYADLTDHRKAVYDILRKVGHDVIAMEDYVAMDERPASRCVLDVASSDLYVGLVGWRYGYVPLEGNPEGRSVTEMEFREAGRAKVHRLMFLAHPEAPFPETSRDAGTGANGGGRKVKEFRAEIGRDFLVGQFKTPDHLAGLVVAAVYRHFEGRAASPASTALEVRLLERRREALILQIERVNDEFLVNIDPAILVRLEARMAQDFKKLAEIEAQIKTKS